MATSTQVQISKPIIAAKMQLLPNQRTFIGGMTGSGKSRMGMYLDGKWAGAGWTVLIIDQDESWINDNLPYAEKPELASVAHPWDITDSGHLHPTARVQIFVPMIPAWEDQRFIALMEEVWQHGTMVLHFDELFGVVDTAHMPVIMKKLWAGGRKRKIVIIAISQRPVDLPKIITSQAEVKMCFLMLDEDDLERMSHMMFTPRIRVEILPDYWHWYWVKGMRSAEKRGPLPKSEVL